MIYIPDVIFSENPHKQVLPDDDTQIEACIHEFGDCGYTIASLTADDMAALVQGQVVCIEVLAEYTVVLKMAPTASNR